MTSAALQARITSLELDGREQRETLESLEEGVAKTTRRMDELASRVATLETAGGTEAAKRLEAVEGRVAETTRMQLELASHDDRLDAVEEALTEGKKAAGGPGPDTSAELLSLDGRLGALEARLAEAEAAPELRHRLEAAEVGLLDAQRALAATRNELRARDEAYAALEARLAELEARPASPPAATAPPAPAAPPASTEAAATPSAVPLTAVKGIGPKLSEKLASAGLEDAAGLVELDRPALDALSARSGIQRGRLVRLREAARELVG